MDLDEVAKYVWSDSQIVLRWIRSGETKNECRLVVNRLMEICKAGVGFRYMATAENPADNATRYCEPEQVMGDEPWWEVLWWLEKEEVTSVRGYDSVRTKPRREQNRRSISSG